MHIPADAFLLRPNHPGTLQSQLRELVVEGILSGRFGRGARLPSSRKLAAQLQVSRITVTLAYTELVASDYLESRGRSGYFISATAPAPRTIPPPQAESRVDWPRVLGARPPEGPTLRRPQDWRSYRYNFIYGQTDPGLFDHQSWRRCALDAMGMRDFAAMTADYYDQDDPALIEAVIRTILPRRGISARPDEVLITLGAQNALWILAQILLTQRRTAVMERPGYPALREILEQSRCTLLAQDIDAQGLDPDTLPQGIDVVFTTPSHHCPSSVVMPLARRQSLLARAAQQDFLVVEDDYESELGFLAPPTPALKSLDSEGRVAYIGSFSKSLFPGLRLGYLVAPAPLIAEARALRTLVLRHPPGHLQRAVAYYLTRGFYDAQMERIARTFRARRAVMDAEIARQGLSFASTNSFGGSSVWMRAPGEILAADLARALIPQSVLIEPGGAFWGREGAESSDFRLAYSSIAAKDIPEGIARVASALQGLRAPK